MKTPQLDLRGAGRLVLLWLLLAAAFMSAASLGQALAVPSGGSPGWSPFWLPGGVALAGILLFGSRAAPGVFGGALAAELILGQGLFAALLFALANAAEALLGAFLARRWAARASIPGSPRGILSLLAGAATAAFAISASLGALSLLQAGLVRAPDLGVVWLSWGLGNLAGTSLLAPLFVAAAREDFRAWARSRWLEAGLVLCATYGLAEAVFGPWMPALHGSVPPLFLPFLALLWAGLRCGPFVAALAAALLGVTVVWHTAQGLGLFAAGALRESWAGLQGYVLCSAVFALVVAGVLGQARSPGTQPAGEATGREHAAAYR